MARFPRVDNRELTDGHLLRSLALLTGPMLVSALLQNLQSLIDLFWVGSLGPGALAAVAMSGTVLMLLFPMMMGLSTGTVALVARAVGGERWDEAGHAASQSLLLALVAGGLTGLLAPLITNRMLHLLGSTPEVLADGGAYLRISLWGSFTVFVLFIGNAALQGAGDAVTPMIIMVIGNVLNLILDPLFIFGWGPVPAMGVRGAALATVLAQAVSAAVAVTILLSGRSRLHARPRQWRPDMEVCWRILRIGIPGSGQMLARSLNGAVLMRIVASCGTAAVAAYGTGLRLHMFILMPAFTLGGAAATLVGQNLGAGKPDRARRAAWLATGIDVGVMVVAAIALALSAPLLIRAFNDDPEVIHIGAQYLRVISPFYVFAALGIVLGRSLNGAGDSLTPMIMTVVSLWGLQVPLAVGLSRVWEPPTVGIWWAIAAATALHGALIALWFETGRWQRARV
ncbi:MAG: Multidrug resistance protein NorM [Lentisphaerae bacterium ADurb.BinA184]|nr:MAG: Multidrug resistance protein NorM [Lentisphaerae bacterium ADurb.BinA184]